MLGKIFQDASVSFTERNGSTIVTYAVVERLRTALWQITLILHPLTLVREISDEEDIVFGKVSFPKNSWYKFHTKLNFN